MGGKALSTDGPLCAEDVRTAGQEGKLGIRGALAASAALLCYPAIDLEIWEGTSPSDDRNTLDSERPC